jgi:ABC-type multidrug transport system ATPase subunit
MYAICVENLVKRYGDNEVLKKVNLKIEEGEFYALMGPNGSGKTTLVSIIASVTSPTSGIVRIYEHREAKELISYVPQENFSSPLLTGKENLIYFGRLYGFSKNEAKNRKYIEKNRTFRSIRDESLKLFGRNEKKIGGCNRFLSRNKNFNSRRADYRFGSIG